MTVYVAHAPADRETAEALERFLERRGQFSELDDGQTAQPPVQAGDVLVLLVSNVLAFAQTRLRLEQRALDAWAEGRLIIVKLDQSLAPVGLRDLPALDASDAETREQTWHTLGNTLRDMLGSAGARTTAQSRPRKARGSGLARVLVLLALMAPGLIAIAASASIWLVNRIGPRPGGWPELIAGIESFGVRYGLPPAAAPWLFALALALMALAAALLLRGGSHRRPRAPSAPAAENAPGLAGAVLVACAEADESRVAPLIEAAKAQGRAIVLAARAPPRLGADAVREASAVVIVCSPAAFESDWVKRAVYLADRYGKRPVTVYIEAATLPEDFAYFLAGAQPQLLFEAPEADRPQAFLAVLG